MKHIDEYRSPKLVHQLTQTIAEETKGSWTIMEICGGQTHSIVKHGLDRLLPASISLLHGPGCPVCVTPAQKIDQAISLARQGAILCSFGDMLRVPGTAGDLLTAKAEGADVRVVYSPLDALRTATEAPDREVVFFAVGFETTAPANALAVKLAAEKGVSNFSLLASHVLVPPAIRVILEAPDNRVQGFLAAGHVCTVTGEGQYAPLCNTYKVPIVITGFEPVDILSGILACIRQLERGEAKVENRYERSAKAIGNSQAQQTVAQVFELCDRDWRGVGAIEQSGLKLRPYYQRFDASVRLDHMLRTDLPKKDERSLCRAGDVLVGKIKPSTCPAFGTTCRPENPLGAPMVSSEGACAAYYHYRKVDATKRGEVHAR